MTKIKKLEILDNLAYRIIKIELGPIFLSLYDPHGILHHIHAIIEFFQKVFQCLSVEIFSEVLQKSFFYFIDYWKLSIIRAKPQKPPDEKIKELKQETKSISIFFESKQGDGNIYGISRITQREYLQNNFDCISLCINDSEDLIKRFKTTLNLEERTSIAWILIARGEKACLQYLVDNKSLLLS